MMEIASASPDQKEINAMVEAMFVKSGLQGNTSLNFEDFFSLLGQQGHLLSRASLDWKGRMAIRPIHMNSIIHALEQQMLVANSLHLSLNITIIQGWSLLICRQG